MGGIGSSVCVSGGAGVPVRGRDARKAVQLGGVSRDSPQPLCRDPPVSQAANSFDVPEQVLDAHVLELAQIATRQERLRRLDRVGLDDATDLVTRAVLDRFSGHVAGDSTRRTMYEWCELFSAATRGEPQSPHPDPSVSVWHVDQVKGHTTTTQRAHQVVEPIRANKS